MTEQATTRSIDELIEGGHTIAMLMTMTDGDHESRPVTCIEAKNGVMSFLVGKSLDWVQAIDSGRAVTHITVSDERHNMYVAVNGSATVTTNASDRQRLWTPAAKIWFDGPDDPELAVLHFTVDEGKYWDGPGGKISKALGFVRGLLTGSDESLGEQGKVKS